MDEKIVGVPGRGPYSVLACIMLGSIMGPIDASIVNVILPTITQIFGVSLSTAQWVPMIYLLTISSLLLFYGRIGDMIGYKKVYLAGLTGFIAASGLCGLSPTVHWLILFRALQGLAAGMMMAVPYAIITASFPAYGAGQSARDQRHQHLGGSCGRTFAGRVYHIPVGLAVCVSDQRSDRHHSPALGSPGHPLPEGTAGKDRYHGRRHRVCVPVLFPVVRQSIAKFGLQLYQRRHPFACRPVRRRVSCARRAGQRSRC